MRKYRRHFTYTNIVGSLALFIALGGVAWASTLPKNSVGSAQIKKNAVTAKAIKDKTITGSDIKNNAISGEKINLGSLGTVPNAVKAGNATSTGDKLPSSVRRVPATTMLAPDLQTAVETAPGVDLLKHGALTITGKCVGYGASLYAYLVATSAKDGTVTSFPFSQSFYGSPFLNPGRSQYMSYILQNSVGSNSASYLNSSAYGGTGTMVDVDGNGIQFHVSGWLKNGTIPAGDGAYGPGSACLYAADGAKLTPG